MMEGNKSEAKRQTLYDFSHVWYMRKEKKKNIKKMNKPIHIKRNTQIQRTEQFPEERRGGGKMDKEGQLCGDSWKLIFWQ